MSTFPFLYNLMNTDSFYDLLHLSPTDNKQNYTKYADFINTWSWWDVGVYVRSPLSIFFSLPTSENVRRMTAYLKGAVTSCTNVNCLYQNKLYSCKHIQIAWYNFQYSANAWKITFVCFLFFSSLFIKNHYKVCMSNRQL